MHLRSENRGPVSGTEGRSGPGGEKKELSVLDWKACHRTVLGEYFGGEGQFNVLRKRMLVSNKAGTGAEPRERKIVITFKRKIRPARERNF